MSKPKGWLNNPGPPNFALLYFPVAPAAIAPDNLNLLVPC